MESAHAKQAIISSRISGNSSVLRRGRMARSSPLTYNFRHKEAHMSGSYARPGHDWSPLSWVADHLQRAATCASSRSTSTHSAYQQGHDPRRAAAGTGPRSSATRCVRDIIPHAKLEELLGRRRHRQRHDGHPLRRQQQLVRGLGLLAAEDLRPQGRPAHGRRPQEMARRRSRADDRGAVSRQPKTYTATDPDLSLRAFLPEVQQCARRARQQALVDVRSPQEFTGKILAPPGLPETCQRGGHIPGAKSIPWARPATRTARSRAADELAALYERAGRRLRDKPVDRLLPHRRALQPHVVRSQVPARLSTT